MSGNQPEGQMPIVLATYSTNKIIVLKRYVSEQQKRNKQTNTHKQSPGIFLENASWGGVKNYWGRGFLFLPPLSLPSSSLPLSLPPPPSPSFPSPFLPLEVGPLESSLGAWGSAVSSPSGVWGGASDEIEFSAF